MTAEHNQLFFLYKVESLESSFGQGRRTHY